MKSCAGCEQLSESVSVSMTTRLRTNALRYFTPSVCEREIASGAFDVGSVFGWLVDGVADGLIDRLVGWVSDRLTISICVVVIIIKSICRC